MAWGFSIQKVASCHRNFSSFMYTRTQKTPNPARSRKGSRKRRINTKKMRPIGLLTQSDAGACRIRRPFEASARHYIKKSWLSEKESSGAVMSQLDSGLKGHGFRGGGKA